MEQINPRIMAILTELKEALSNFASSGKTHRIFLGSIGLPEPEQVELLELLGEGELSIDLKNLDEPVTWYETNYAGIWVGTFRNLRGEAILRTIEVCAYPELAASQQEDVNAALGKFDILFEH
ncbi:MAG: hydrogenase expression/formation C-terminal domain-containing protein [Coriobacteriia bacterium]|nr:hydrogenase expression/formation C-terminal domain-containing protein [Coriobacteriia bacterium]